MAALHKLNCHGKISSTKTIGQNAMIPRFSMGSLSAFGVSGIGFVPAD
jgi:hypothetical protein